MMLINLLPHREEARKKQREHFFTQLGLAVVLGGVIGGVIYTGYQTRIETQRSRNAYLQAEIAKLDAEIKEIAGLQTQLAALKARQAAVEDLQSDRNLPVHLFEELVKQVPEGVYLATLKQENQNILITGVAQSQERVSEFLRNLSNNSQWLVRPDLVEIVAANLALNHREQRRVSNFSIRVSLKRSESEKQPAPAVPAGKV